MIIAIAITAITTTIATVTITTNTAATRIIAITTCLPSLFFPFCSNFYCHLKFLNTKVTHVRYRKIKKLEII